MFVHLSVHSSFSRLCSTDTPADFLKRAKSFGMGHLALTEVNGLWSFINFVHAARKTGIRAIAGSNIINSTGELLLFAENHKGYENICRILSDLHARPEIDIVEAAKKQSQGIFFLAHEALLLKRLQRFVPDARLFVELRPGISEKTASGLARSFRLEMVATSDVYFLEQKQHKSHRILRAISLNTTLCGLDEANYKSQQCFFCDETEMKRRYPNSREAINNSYYLARRCKSDWSFINTIFPKMSLKDTYRANEKLRRLVYQGAQMRFAKITPAVKNRIEKELALITQKGFSSYFLVVHDIVSQTKATIGRGSGAGSIVSYCLFITQVDPIKYNLSFERFMHADRTDMPDLDVDFCWDERDDILDYVFTKYGKDRTAMVSNQVFLQPRSAVREVGKVYGLANEELNQLTKRLSRSFSRDIIGGLRKRGSFRHMQKDETIMEVLAESEKIVGAFHMSSVHPGGVIIVPDDIKKYVPVLMARKGVQIVEWDKEQVEDSGLLKIDLLGNRSLSVVRDTLKQLHESEAKKIDYHSLSPVDDAKTGALLARGKSMGIFYVESPASRQLLGRAKRVDFEHVVLYTSIIRPAANRYVNLLLARIHGQSWQLLHKDLHCLAETYGIMVYEDQVGYVARKIAGFSFSQADALRKTMAWESKHYLLPLWKKLFFAGARERGYAEKLIGELWDMISSFIGYSFCKAHSASYAMLSFTCAYLKAHYPAQFIAAVISNGGGFYSTYAYLSEARRMGIKILSPDINKSELHSFGYGRTIRLGFSHICNLSSTAKKKLLAEREKGAFVSLADFLKRCSITMSDCMILARAGCFKELSAGGNYRRQALAILYHHSRKREVATEVNLSPIHFSPEETRDLELQTLGFSFTHHPLTFFTEYFKGKIIQAKELKSHVDKRVRLLGVHITHKVVPTKNGKRMAFLTLEDESDIYECTLFPDAYRCADDLLRWERLFLVEGRVEIFYGIINLTISNLFSLNRLLRKFRGTG
ncbi:DNA polymerase III subunit alpha [Candidatus Riflebacteria bacterium]